MELLSPAGSFSSGVYAYQFGADAVYAGMKQFSARSAAVNMSFDELRRLKQLAADSGKKLYIAFNTLITQDELDPMMPLLDQCAYLQVDGLIIQDLGVCRTVRRYFPALRLHGSTQMAVHTADGAKALTDAGFSRVVLSRELSVGEISGIIRSVPDIEYEVFVHGALCCSFSGLCLASGMLLGRSANRGRCAQICRTWFERDSRQGYWFSMKDLDASGMIEELKRIGAASCKIEGRMKSPEYTGTVTARYRRLIDGLPPDEDLERQLSAVFSRRTTKGWLGDTDQPLTDPGYPSHRGVIAASVIGQVQEYTAVKLTEALSLRDGIRYEIPSGDPGRLPGQVRCSIRGLILGNRRVTRAEPGMTVLLSLPQTPAVGSVLYKISDHSIRWSTPGISSCKPFQHPLPMHAAVTDQSAEITARFPWRGDEHRIVFHDVLPVEQARNPFDLEKKLEQTFLKSSESLFRPGDFTWENRSSYPDTHLFIPPSRLKALRRSCYKELDAQFTRKRWDVHQEGGGPSAAGVPPRSSLSPDSDRPIPFITDPRRYVPEDLPLFEGRRCLPLHPVLCDPRYEQDLADLAERCSKVLVGISNIGHLPLAEKLAETADAVLWIDVFCYIANSAAARQLQQMSRVPIRFGYYWIEQSQLPWRGTWPFPLGPVGEDFRPPLFISRLSAYSGLRGSETQRNYELRQGNRMFQVIEQGGFSYFFSSSPSGEIRG